MVGTRLCLALQGERLSLIPLLEVGGLVKRDGDNSKTVTSKIIL